MPDPLFEHKTKLIKAEGYPPLGWVLFIIDGNPENMTLHNMMWMPRSFANRLIHIRKQGVKFKKSVLKKQLAPIKKRYLRMWSEFDDLKTKKEWEKAKIKAAWIQKQFGTDMSRWSVWSKKKLKKEAKKL